MRYYFDSNTWIAIFDHRRIYEKLLGAYSEGKIEIALHQENIWELVENPEIDRAKAQRNKALLKPFGTELQADGIFVTGHSALGMAKLPDQTSTQIFGQHLKRKTNKERALGDAIHLANAAHGQSTIVSCDNQVNSTAAAWRMSWFCFLDFLELYSWSQENLTRCKACRRCVD